MTEKLKPCPFCGGEAKINKREYSIECTRCSAYMGYFYTKQEAIEAWNRRVTDDPA